MRQHQFVFLAFCLVTLMLLTALDIREQKQTNQLLQEQNSMLADEGELTPLNEEIQFTVTAYTPRYQETNSEPHITATLEKPIAGWTCAVSRDYMHWLGGRVYIPDIGVRRVNDLMHDRFSKTIDIVVGKVEHAKRFGIQSKPVVFLGR